MRIRRRLVAAALGAALLASTSPAGADVQIVSAERRPPGACIIILNIAICY